MEMRKKDILETDVGDSENARNIIKRKQKIVKEKNVEKTNEE